MIALTADWHITRANLTHFLAQYRAMIEECHRANVSRVIVAGDIFDKESIDRCPGEVIRPVREAIEASGIEHTFISGNHDFDGPRNASAIFCLPGDCIHEPSIRELNIRGTHYRGLFRFLYLPWKYEGGMQSAIERLLQENADLMNEHQCKERMIQELSVELQRAPSGAATSRFHIRNILIGHGHITGGYYRPGVHYEAEKPGDWSVSREYLQGLLDSGRVDKIAFGDFHARQPFYIGALRQLNFGEIKNPAGFELWNPITNESRWVELDAAPRYGRVTIRSEADWDLIAYGPAGDVPDEKKPFREIVFDGFTPPNPEELDRLESEGFRVARVTDRPERVAREVEITEGLMSRPEELIRLWATQNGRDVDALIAAFRAENIT